MSFKKQSGMTMIGWMFVLSIIGAIAFVGISIVPIYIDDMAVKKSLNVIVEQNGTELAKMSKRKIWDGIRKYLRVNQISHVTDENLFITKNKQGFRVITIKYQAKKHIAGNVEALMTFEHSIEVAGR